MATRESMRRRVAQDAVGIRALQHVSDSDLASATPQFSGQLGTCDAIREDAVSDEWREALIDVGWYHSARFAAPHMRVASHSKVIINSLPPFTRYIKRSRPDNVRPSDEKLPTTDEEIVTPPAHCQALR